MTDPRSKPLNFDTFPAGIEVIEGGMVQILWRLAGGCPLGDESELHGWEETKPAEMM